MSCICVVSSYVPEYVINISVVLFDVTLSILISTPSLHVNLVLFSNAKMIVDVTAAVITIVTMITQVCITM